MDIKKDSLCFSQQEECRELVNYPLSSSAVLLLECVTIYYSLTRGIGARDVWDSTSMKFVTVQVL